MRTSQRGITLIELLIAACIAGILFGVAMPAFSGAFEASRAIQTRTALMSSYMAAINGATLAGSHAVLCPSSNGMTCASGLDWSGGWIAFLDTNADREHQPGEPILSRQAALPGKVRLHSTVGRTRIVIQPNGGVAGSNVTFTLCDGRGKTRAEALVLSNKSVLRAGVPTPAAIETTCVR